MLRSMFGMGGTEILVILIVALLFLGPDKLPEAAKQISKGIRDIKKQSRVLQRTIEEDENIGGAIRDLKSALRGEDEPIRPRPLKPPKQLADPASPTLAAAATLAAPAIPEPGTPEHGAGPDAPAEPRIHGDLGGHEGTATAADQPALTMPPTAGEPDDAMPATSSASEDAELAAMVKPAAHTIPHKSPSLTELPPLTEPPPVTEPKPVTELPPVTEPKHG
jgi:sec-independent protein translocase protein TatB